MKGFVILSMGNLKSNHLGALGTFEERYGPLGLAEYKYKYRLVVEERVEVARVDLLASSLLRIESKLEV